MASGRRIAPWVLLTVVLGVTAFGVYKLIERFSTFDPSLGINQFLLPALSLALVVLSVGLAGILIRNLVRLIVDRKRGILGARLRTKLVFFFLALVLLPATVLFVGSAQIIKQTVEAILRTPLEDLTRQSELFVDEWTDYFQEQTTRQAERIATEIGSRDLVESEQQELLLGLMQRWQAEHDLELVRLTRDSRIVAQSRQFSADGSPSLDNELERLVDAALEAVATDGRPVAHVNRFGEGLLAYATRALPDDPRYAVTVAIVLPAPLAGNLDGFAAANQNYRKFRAQRKQLIRLYLSLIGLIFLVTVLIATWIGFYLSRRITVPIQEMAAAAREISTGNLAVRVHTQVGDEVGTLVEAFNEMAAELQESREVITRSTSDLRRSNRALDERRRYIETLLANLSTAVISLDPGGRVTTANPAVTTILGIKLHPGDEARAELARHGLAPLAELLDREMRTGAGLPHDLSLKHRGGLHIAVQVSPLRSGAGDRVGTLVMVEDLTDLIRAQRAAAWREVAQRIAHEIKNPLTPIQLAAQRLRKKFDVGSDDLERVVSESTSSIEREVGALKQMIDEFSKFARMPEIAPQVVSFPELVKSVLALYEGVTQIEWQVEIDPSIGDVLLDPQQIRRVLINLIDNAVAALGESGGSVRVHATQIGSEGLRIEVADTGPGIPATDRDRMFVPYFSTKRQGSGLGLAIVHKVVTDHRGTIRVEDNSPHGARFVIDIPA